MGEYRRFFANGISGDSIILDGQQHQHLSVVLRLKVGDEVIVNVNDNFDYYCAIDKIDKASTTLSIVKKQLSAAELPIDITLFQCVIKGDKMELVLQKAVELGVNKIIPVHTTYTVVKADDKQDRYNKITMEAAKQCGRSKIVQVSRVIDFNTMLRQLSAYNRVMFCNEREKVNSIVDGLQGVEGNLAIVVGAEGGFSDSEISKLIDLDNARSVTLGSRILRAETAAIAALSVCSILIESISEAKQ